MSSDWIYRRTCLLEVIQRFGNRDWSLLPIRLAPLKMCTDTELSVLSDVITFAALEQLVEFLEFR